MAVAPKRRGRDQDRHTRPLPCPALSVREARLKAAELALKRQAHSPTVEEAAEQWLTERIDLTLKNAEPIRPTSSAPLSPSLAHGACATSNPPTWPASCGHTATAPQSRRRPRLAAGGAPAPCWAWHAQDLVECAHRRFAFRSSATRRLNSANSLAGVAFGTCRRCSRTFFARFDSVIIIPSRLRAEPLSGQISGPGGGG